MAEEKENIADETDDEIEDLRRYIEEFIAFLPLAFCITNPDDFILGANEAFEKLTGYERTDLIGMSVDSLFKNEEEIKDFKKKIPESISAIEEETVLKTKTGKDIFVQISALARRDKEGNFSGSFFTISDITKAREFRQKMKEEVRKRTKELQEAKERLEESEAVLEVKIKARTRELAELNESLEDEVKRRTAELEKKAEESEDSKLALLNILEDVDQSLKEAERERKKTSAVITSFVDGLFLFDREKNLSFVNPEAEKLFGVKAEDVVKKNVKELAAVSPLKPLIKAIGSNIKKLFREEIRVGGETFMEVTTIPIKREEDVIGTLVTVHDITREKGIERMKSEFVSVAAHQLRTPISGIKWTLRTILDEPESIPEEYIDFVEKAYEANERMVTLVNDLLNVTRIEEGRYVYKPEDNDIIAIMEPIIESYAEKIERKGIKFKFNKPSKKVPKIKLDKEKIGMIIHNLLDNAVKYTKEGEISVDVVLESDKVKASVADTGAGIPEDQKQRMFSKFFRGANVIRMETEGSGLGLFIAKNIVEAHGGEIGFLSKEGEGSTFYFTLPLNHH